MNKENNTTMNEFAELLRREQPHFMRYACYRFGDTDDAKDALQETCHKLCDKFTTDEGKDVKKLEKLHFSHSVKCLRNKSFTVETIRNCSIGFSL